MKWMRIVGIVVAAVFFVSSAALAVMFIWMDPDGSYRATEQIENVPPKYRAVVRWDTNSYTSPSGIGFERDENGNFYFFDHSSPAQNSTQRTSSSNSSAAMMGAPGDPVTPEELAAIRERYQMWGGEPVPEVMPARVVKIVSPDVFQLEGGQQASYIGIEFPAELRSNTRFQQEVMNYEKKIMQGQTAHLLFGPRRTDEQGRLLSFVFIGTEMFVNADLVMNGYARVKTVPPNIEYRDLFLRLQNFAQGKKLGMWALPGVKK